MARNIWMARLVLLPISKIYGAGVWLRNKLFDWGILRQRTFSVPVITVGNLAVGGTGKTPHVEYLIELLRHSHHIGVVSRGYRRDTKGFVMAGRRSTPSDIGDEPYQIYHKFDGAVPVAVCEDRAAGIEELLRIDPNINLVILDDGFQHRYVKPRLGVVLTEYGHPVFEDHLLPYGTLREPKSALRRADMVIVTKCTPSATALDYSIFIKNLDLQPFQSLFFTRMVYRPLRPVFPDQAPAVAPSLEWLTDDDMLLTVAGIANPRPFVRHVKGYRPKVRVNVFADHHNFTRRDMQLILSRFKSLTGRANFIITTEKDAVRLANCPYFPHELKPYIYYLPIRAEVIRDPEPELLTAINRHIK